MKNDANSQTVKYHVQLQFCEEWDDCWNCDSYEEAKKMKEMLDKAYHETKHRIVKVTTIKEIVE